MNSLYDESEYLEHYGIKGMKWGERRFQDENGRLTPLGKVRYGLGKLTGSNARKDYDDFEDAEAYYRSRAESYQKIRNDKIAEAMDYQIQLEKVKKQRTDYAASPGATARKLAVYDKKIARLEKIIEMYNEHPGLASPENIAREQRSANRMYLNKKASYDEDQLAPMNRAGKEAKEAIREAADNLVEKAVSKSAPIVTSISDITKGVYKESVSTGEKYISSLMSGLGKLKKKFK